MSAGTRTRVHACTRAWTALKCLSTTQIFHMTNHQNFKAWNRSTVLNDLLINCSSVISELVKICLIYYLVRRAESKRLIPHKYHWTPLTSPRQDRPPRRRDPDHQARQPIERREWGRSGVAGRTQGAGEEVQRSGPLGQGGGDILRHRYRHHCKVSERSVPCSLTKISMSSFNSLSAKYFF